MRIINRAEKRFYEREEQKKEKKLLKEQQNLNNWFKSWTPQQQQFHKNMILAMADEANKTIEEIMDSCYIAAMIQETELSLEQCINICKLADKHMIETKNKIEKDGERYLKMIKDEKLIIQIKEEVKVIIKENKKTNNLEIIKTLKENYDLPNKDLQIIIKETRQELEKEIMKELESSIGNEVAAEKEEISNYANGEIKTNLHMEGEHGIELTVDKENKKAIPVEDVLKELGVIDAEFVNPNKPQNEEMTIDKEGIKITCNPTGNLKIKSIQIEVEGKHGIYIKTNRGITTDDTLYKNLEEMTAEKENFTNNIYEQEKELCKKLEELREYKTKEIEKYAEIEQVFNM